MLDYTGLRKKKYDKIPKNVLQGEVYIKIKKYFIKLAIYNRKYDYQTEQNTMR